MDNLFLTLEFLQTPSGLIFATILFTNFIKWLLNKNDVVFDESITFRFLTVGVALLLFFVFNNEYLVDLQGITLGVFNSFYIALASMGLYDFNESLDER